MGWQPSIVIVTAPTRYQGLMQRWGTRGQARFRLNMAKQHAQEEVDAAASSSRSRRPPRTMPRSVNSEPPRSAAGAAAQAEAAFTQYEAEHRQYSVALEQLRAELELGFPVTLVERRYVPTYEFRNAMLVVVIGQDGLVANTAKYVGDLPIIGVNPDPQRYDGVLLPYQVHQVRGAVESVLADRAQLQLVTMAQARLNDGQQILAFNDLFIGRRSHVSARYNLLTPRGSETQSSSGVIVATGAGSTGWLSSIFNMMRGVVGWTGGTSGEPPRLQWHDRRLAWVVREPFASRHSQANLVAGMIDSGGELILESLMPEGGAIFSDGIEDDYLEFNSGAIVHIGFAPHQAKIVVPVETGRRS